ncbi:MAG: hypothetical protein JWL59_406 [Chthoniobacteraceae bacterium]|nr:hypothetical protein [Chthoniobacteraceae bacterium]
MRGSPLIRALIAFLVLLVLGWPLWNLTHAPAKQPSPVVPAVSAETPLKMVALQLTFTTVPSRLKILHLGKEVWAQAVSAQDVEVELQLPYPEKGIDLQFEIAWPGDALAAMRVKLSDPAGTEHEKTLWGRGEVNDVLAFP